MSSFADQAREAPAPHVTPRRTFLGQVSATLALGALGCASASASGPGARASSIPAHDEPWAKRIREAQYRFAVDCPAIDKGIGIGQAVVVWDSFKSQLGAADPEVGAVAVIRHRGVPMVFGDALWDRYELGKTLELKDPTSGEPARRNPFLASAPGDRFAMLPPTMTLRAFHERGGVILACENAAMGYANQFAHQTGRDAATVRKEVRETLVPGTVLLPNGLYALVRAQTLGCAYLRAELP